MFTAMGPDSPICTKHNMEKIPDPALERIIAPCPTTTRGAASVLNVHPKEPKLIYCSGKLVVVRSLEDPTDCLVYRGHNEPTTVAQFSPNGFWVASADTTGKVRIWSYDHPEHILKLEVNALAGRVDDLQWDCESKRIVVVGQSRGILARVFAWDTGSSLGEITGHQKRIQSVAFKPTRPFRIMTASEDFNVCTHQGPPFTFLHCSNNGHKNYANCIRYSPKGDLAISVGSDKEIFLYDGTTGELLEKFPSQHNGSIYSVCWSPDGSQLLTSSADKTVVLWDVSSRSVIKTFCFGGKKPELADMQVAVVWKNDYMLSLSLSGNINYLDMMTPNQPKRIIQGHQVSITSLTMDPSRQVILTGSYDSIVCSWHDRIASVLGGCAHTGKITGIAASSKQVASVSWDDTIRVADVQEDGSFLYRVSKMLDCQPTSVVMVPSLASLLAVVGTNKGLKVVHEENHELKLVTFSINWTPNCIAISPEGSLIAVGAQGNHVIHLFELRDKSLHGVGELAGHLGPVTCLAFSPDGGYLAAGDTQRDVRVWDIASLQPKIEKLWVYHTTRIASVAWSPSGKYIVSGSSDESIYIWNVETPLTKRCFHLTHKEGVTSVAFLEEEKLISVGNDACVRFWNLT
uniref:Uncharacterized protein AlNc14C115G6510 n=1 Tax=Albugo laibachii Nc14 TaxID=890382 RepID=F0WIX4_9STRA|nr:conserved hypothetical protein [Albugo laibachii Nc14]|eukprot:CCA21220.1 conserved hypothetical protein [Albugo laibachii Nc14]